MNEELKSNGNNEDFLAVDVYVRERVIQMDF